MMMAMYTALDINGDDDDDDDGDDVAVLQLAYSLSPPPRTSCGPPHSRAPVTNKHSRSISYAALLRHVRDRPSTDMHLTTSCV